MNTEILTRDRAPTRWVHPLDGATAQASQRRDASLAADAPPLGNRDFFVGKSLSQLAREQRVGPVKDIGVFAGGFPEYEDLDELLAELDHLRGS
jgi:hypothetical protein